MRKDGENFQTESMVRDEKVEEKRDDELVSLPRMYTTSQKGSPISTTLFNILTLILISYYTIRYLFLHT